MGCCQCQGIEKMFDKKTALKELKRFRKKGVNKTTGLLLDAILKEGIKGFNFLDIGGGIGIIQHELINKGATKGTSIDASDAYLEVARGFAHEENIANKMNYRHGDFIELSKDEDAVDIVTLDKVICCYDDMPSLVNKSSRLARKIYGVVYIREVWWTKLFLPLMNLYPKIMGNSFRAFIHPTKKVEAIIINNGLKPLFYKTTLFWQVAVYSH